MIIMDGYIAWSFDFVLFVGGDDIIWTGPPNWELASK